MKDETKSSPLLVESEEPGLQAHVDRDLHARLGHIALDPVLHAQRTPVGQDEVIQAYGSF